MSEDTGFSEIATSLQTFQTELRNTASCETLGGSNAFLQGARGGGVFSLCMLSYDHRPSHPYYAGTEHVGFSPTRQTLLALSAERREVIGESHER